MHTSNAVGENQKLSLQVWEREYQNKRWCGWMGIPFSSGWCSFIFALNISFYSPNNVMFVKVKCGACSYNLWRRESVTWNIVNKTEICFNSWIVNLRAKFNIHDDQHLFKIHVWCFVTYAGWFPPYLGLATCSEYPTAQVQANHN